MIPVTRSGGKGWAISCLGRESGLRGSPGTRRVAAVGPTEGLPVRGGPGQPRRRPAADRETFGQALGRGRETRAQLRSGTRAGSGDPRPTRFGQHSGGVGRPAPNVTPGGVGDPRLLRSTGAGRRPAPNFGRAGSGAPGPNSPAGSETRPNFAWRGVGRPAPNFGQAWAGSGDPRPDFRHRRVGDPRRTDSAAGSGDPRRTTPVPAGSGDPRPTSVKHGRGRETRAQLRSLRAGSGDPRPTTAALGGVGRPAPNFKHSAGSGDERPTTIRLTSEA